MNVDRAVTAAFLYLILLGAVAPNLCAARKTVDFEEFPLAPESFDNGSEFSGDFTSQNITFNNQFTDFGGGCCWSGWAISNTTDQVTAGAVNQYSAFPGSGANGSLQYGVAFDGLSGGGGIQPEITLPEGDEPVSIQVANTTFAALSMQQGDAFAKRFGGLTGNDPDWFRLHIEGRTVEDAVLGEVALYLADFRFADNSQDYILSEWAELDLSPLRGLGVATLALRFTSSDVGMFGINTPLYVAIDDLVVDKACGEAAAGDFNADCNVDQQDLAIWSANYGEFEEPTALPTDGDANADGLVIGDDFLIWQQTADTASASSSLAVPEPTVAALFFCMMLFSCKTHRQRPITTTTRSQLTL